MDDEPRMIELAPGLHLRQEVDNILWADMGDYAVVVDALEQPQLEREVFAAIARTIGDKPVRYVLNTHMHNDHTALHPAFERRGARVVCQAAGVQRAGRDYVTFTDAWRAGADRRDVEMCAIGPCHTPEDALIWFPRDRVLCVGDLFGWGLVPGAVRRPEGRQRVLDVYAKIISFDAQHIVPGHGPVATTAHMQRWVRYFGELVAAFDDLRRAGKSAAEIRTAIPPPDDMTDWWRFRDWKHDYNLDQLLDG